LNLWTEFKIHICNDLKHQIQHNFANFIDGERTEDDTYNYGLFLIVQILQKSGNRLINFPDLPAVTGAWLKIAGNQLIFEQRNYNVADESVKAQQNIVMLNASQRVVHDEIVQAIAGESLQKLFFC